MDGCAGRETGGNGNGGGVSAGSEQFIDRAGGASVGADNETIGGGSGNIGI